MHSRSQPVTSYNVLLHARAQASPATVPNPWQQISPEGILLHALLVQFKASQGQPTTASVAVQSPGSRPHLKASSCTPCMTGTGAPPVSLRPLPATEWVVEGASPPSVLLLPDS